MVARNPTHALGNIIEESGPRLGRHSQAPLENARPRVLGEVGGGKCVRAAARISSTVTVSIRKS